MDATGFLNDFQDLLQCDMAITPEVRLGDLEEWDSMAMMACMAYMDKKFGTTLRFSQFKEMKTVSDLMKVVGL